MLGAEQKAWFFGELDKTKARWNVIANEVIMSQMPISIGNPPPFNIDQWDGFTVERQAVIEKFGSLPDLNPLVITGDIHAYGMADLKTTWDDAGTVVAPEFVGGSITSSFLVDGDATALISSAENIRYASGDKHGYAVMHLTADEARCRFRAVDRIDVETSPISTIAEFVVKPGTPAAEQVTPTA
jgi:alkaline phosphatase D